MKNVFTQKQGKFESIRKSTFLGKKEQNAVSIEERKEGRKHQSRNMENAFTFRLDSIVTFIYNFFFICKRKIELNFFLKNLIDIKKSLKIYLIIYFHWLFLVNFKTLRENG